MLVASQPAPHEDSGDRRLPRGHVHLPGAPRAGVHRAGAHRGAAFRPSHAAGRCAVIVSARVPGAPGSEGPGSHLRTKAWARRVHVEVPIGTRRADVWVETERENRVAIEVKASSIPVEELRPSCSTRGVLALYVVHTAVFGPKRSAMAFDDRVLRVPACVREIRTSPAPPLRA